MILAPIAFMMTFGIFFSPFDKRSCIVPQPRNLKIEGIEAYSQKCRYFVWLDVFCISLVI